MTKSNRLFLAATFGIFGFLFWHFAKTMLQLKADGWYVGQVNLYGDLVFHLGLINKFLESNRVLVDNPILAHEKVNYPIFADFLTAQIAKITNIDFALFLTTFMAGLLVIFVARMFILNFIKNEKIVFLTLLIFFVNGGFGFFYLFKDFFLSGEPLTDFIFNLPHEYTDIKERGYWWINTYLAYFLPQRGFLFAFPITLTILSLLYWGVKNVKKSFFILAAILSGILPLVQAHSLFLIFLLCLFFVPASIDHFKKKRKELIINWLVFLSITIILSLAIFRTISTNQPINFIRFDPGWTSQENIIWFWFKNLGIFAPTLIISLIWIFKKNRHLSLLYFPFLMIFVISNLFVFQPWDFDNSKLLIYWFFASCIIVAYFLYDQFFQESLLRKFLGTVIVFIMTFSGAIDLARTFTQVTNYRIFSNDDLEVAQLVKNLTPRDSIFVTAPVHNHPIPALSGRSTLIGYHGWLWSHGIDYQKRASDVSKIYQGGKTAEELITKYELNYVTIGPNEKEAFSINETYFSQYPAIDLTADWKLYDVSNLWSDSNR